MTKITDKELSTKEASELARTSDRTIRIWIKDGKIKAIKRRYGNTHRLFILKSELNAYLKKRNEIIED